MTELKPFKNWREIRDWAIENGYHKMAARMDLNNDGWNSSGELGRSQIEICDAMRFATSEKERHKIAQEIDDATKENFGLW